MKKKIILITGGLGYIGSHAVVAFEQAGYKTIIVDNLDNSCLSTYRRIGKILGYKPDFYEVDLRDYRQMEEIFKKYDFDGVIHFAGLKAVGESCHIPLGYFDNNVIGSIRLFELMEKYGVKNIIFSSSATVYNSENSLPYNEKDSVGKTSNPYGTTKFIIEKILEDLSKFSKFNVINLRYFNPIGAHSSGLLGENVEGEPNNIFPYIMKVISSELKELKIFGDDYDTIDGTGVRDYIDINDLIEGHLRAYEKTSPNPLQIGEVKLRGQEKDFPLFTGKFETYNLGVGKGVSVLELLKACENVVGKKIPYKIVERRSGDLGEVYCNPLKAEKELGWRAKISLEESVANSLRFNEIILGEKK